MVNMLVVIGKRKVEAMNKGVYGKLFGHPQIYLNGQPINFTFGKINALLYYLFVNKTVSRDEIAMLLWPEKDEKSAKKNLRNTIYQANRILGADYIFSPNRQVLTFNDLLSVTSDIEIFQTNPSAHLELYEGQFLKGVILKGSEEFELWSTKMRHFFEKKFASECYQKVLQDLEANNFTGIELAIQRLIAIDEFDERNYQLLMTYYQRVNRHEKVIEVYYGLADILNIELGIEPNQETRHLFELSLKTVEFNSRCSTKRFQTSFFGRLEEIKLLETSLTAFSNGLPTKSFVIKGAGGVGKMSLVNRVLDNIEDDYFILDTQCYELETAYDLRPWRRIFSQVAEALEHEEIMKPDDWRAVVNCYFPNITELMENLENIDSQKHIDLNMLSQVLIEALRTLAKVKKIVIVYKNIQWMDEASFNLLASVLCHMQKQGAVFIFTLRDDIPMMVQHFITSLTSYDLLTEIYLSSLTRGEVNDYLLKELDEESVSEQLVDKLFTLTEGNFFFLTEYVNMLQSNNEFNVMTLKMQDALRARFIHLSTQEMKVVTMVSYFYDYVSLSLIAKLVQLSNLELADIIEKLVRESIFEEQIINDDIKISFSHNRLREFIYMNELESKRYLVHKEIAEILESDIQLFSQDHLIFMKISYHYERAREMLKSLEYQLNYLQTYFKFYHELFPVNDHPDEQFFNNHQFTKDQTQNEFDRLKLKIDQLQVKYQTNRLYQELVLKFYSMLGRFYIRHGVYDKGLEASYFVINQSLDQGASGYLLEGYKQLIYYYIQIDDAAEMSRYIELALNEATRSNNYETIGILLRLKGLYYLMIGEFETAEKHLHESINTFKLTSRIEEKYQINIAAAYDYLAEIRSIQEKYDEAVDLQQYAIDLCANKHAYSSLSVFYINMGIIQFGKKEYIKAKEYFNEAYAIYDRFSSLWKRPQLDAYMALINLYENNFDEVYHYLASSKKYIDRFNNPRVLGTIYFAEAMIKKQLKEHKRNDLQGLTTLLAHDESYYYQKAMENLSQNRNKIETKLLTTVFDGFVVKKVPFRT